MAEVQANLMTRLKAMGAEPIQHSMALQTGVERELQWSMRFDVPMQLGRPWFEEAHGDSRQEFWEREYHASMEKVMEMGLRPTRWSVGVGTDKE